MIKRLIYVLISAFAATFLCFFLMHFSNNSPAYASKNNTISHKMRAQIEEKLNLNKPFLEQYKIWLKSALKGDLGTSFLSGEKVSVLLKNSLPNTLILALSSLVILFILSILFGIFSLLYPKLSNFINILNLSFFALPSFALALLFIMIFSVFFKLLPASLSVDFGFENDLINRLEHLILPVLTLVLSHLAIYANIARASFLQSFHQPFIMNAYARGLSGFEIYFNFLLKDALSPIISYFGANAVAFMMNAYIVESVFSYSGLGSLLIESIIFKDLPLVLAAVFLSVLLSGVLIFISDIICACLSPKIKVFK